MVTMDKKESGFDSSEMINTSKEGRKSYGMSCDVHFRLFSITLIGPVGPHDRVMIISCTWQQIWRVAKLQLCINSTLYEIMLSVATVELKKMSFGCSCVLPNCLAKKPFCSGVWIFRSDWSNLSVHFDVALSKHMKHMSTIKRQQHFWQSLPTTRVNLMAFTWRNHRRSSLNRDLSLADGLKIKGLSQIKGLRHLWQPLMITRLKTVGVYFSGAL